MTRPLARRLTRPLTRARRNAQNGEKQLRRLLTQTTEWKDARARARAAEEVARAADGGESSSSFVFALRASDGISSLRKSHLLTLSRLWGYQSDLWRRRDVASREAHNALMDKKRVSVKAAVPRLGAAAPPLRKEPAKRDREAGGEAEEAQPARAPRRKAVPWFPQPPPVSDAAAAPAAPVRCLDASHPSPCVVSSCPPPFGCCADENSSKLVAPQVYRLLRRARGGGLVLLLAGGGARAQKRGEEAAKPLVRASREAAVCILSRSFF